MCFPLIAAAVAAAAVVLVVVAVRTCVTWCANSQANTANVRMYVCSAFKALKFYETLLSN